MEIKKAAGWLLGVGLILILIVGSILGFGREKKENALTIGVILPGSSDEKGWNGIHYQGVKEACEELGVEIELYENVPEYSGECEKAVLKMAEEGIQMVILESYNYPDEIYEIIEAHPEISFYCCSAEINLANYKAYFARVYQARYLSGIIAGMKTKTNHIGYVAAKDNIEVNRGINAFSLGVRSVNREAEVYVTYTGDWDNEEKEKKGAAALVENCQADILTYHQNQPFVVEAAEELGVDVIGYNIYQGNYSKHLLTSVVSNWKMVYQEMLEDYLQKKEVGVHSYWVGIEKDAVGLAFYSEEITQEMKDEVEAAADQLCNNKEVFSGLIYDNEGNIRCRENEVIRDEILLRQMDWLVEGVKIYEIN